MDTANFAYRIVRALRQKKAIMKEIDGETLKAYD